MFKPVSPKINFPKLEEEILKYWQKNKIFEKTLTKESPKGDWTFLDGPPFITGLPHYGSLLSSIPKDLFPRFKSMQGYKVRRVWGWDCHGLPAENKVEEELGVKRKKDIEDKIGIKKFIDECKRYVGEVSSEWEWYVDHVGRWVDFKNAYKTMNISYMESVMWVFRQMYDKGLIYKGLRVLLYCPHCATPISNFEVAMDTDNYKMLPDPSTIYKYKLKDDKNTYLLAWSTTPWNKIVTPALAVNPDLTYVKVQQGDEKYILAKSTIKMIAQEPKYKIIEEFKGERLVGKIFIPHYDYYIKNEPPRGSPSPLRQGFAGRVGHPRGEGNSKKAFAIIAGDFVTAEEGTGIVTLAAYGEEDLPVMLANNIHVEMHLDDEGNIKSNVPKFGGMYYLKANKYVNEDLLKRGLIYQDKEYLHSVPTCWRCNTRLYQAPQDAWYVNVQKLKQQMKKTNKDINWFPGHFKEGRFLKSLEAAPDWNISRNRYWGSPVPVWECECGERFVPGSIKELEERSGREILELHKPEIDEVTVTCDKCGKKVRRVSEVLDSWIEAGSASFGERHYPFDPSTGSGQKEKLEEFFPPDFVVEYTGQIRAWFYVLHVVANALFDSMGFKNVLVTGVILGTDGRKMSKNYGNYPDPREMLGKYGGDALRLYLLSSPVMNGEDILISEEQYRNQIKGMMLILWNVYNFFVTYANLANWNCDLKRSELTVLDRWILARLTQLVQSANECLEKYNTIGCIRSIEYFVVNDFSTWYIRRSRERVGYLADENDRSCALSVMYGVLVTLSKLLAPITPFIAEEIFRNLTGEESVHLQDYPRGDASLLDEKLVSDMENVRKLIVFGHAKRKELGIKVRQPLAEFRIQNSAFRMDEEFIGLIRDELNVKEVDFIKGAGELVVEFDTNITKELKEEGMARDIVRKIQEERKKLGTALNEKVNVVLDSWPKDFEEEIKKKGLINELKRGTNFKVNRI